MSNHMDTQEAIETILNCVPRANWLKGGNLAANLMRRYYRDGKINAGDFARAADRARERGNEQLARSVWAAFNHHLAED
jgi:hypothetical protein